MYSLNTSRRCLTRPCVVPPGWVTIQFVCSSIISRKTGPLGTCGNMLSDIMSLPLTSGCSDQIPTNPRFNIAAAKESYFSMMPSRTSPCDSSNYCIYAIIVSSSSTSSQNGKNTHCFVTYHIAFNCIAKMLILEISQLFRKRQNECRSPQGPNSLQDF